MTATEADARELAAALEAHVAHTRKPAVTIATLIAYTDQLLRQQEERQADRAA